ncbi:MAG: DUF5652 family protein [Nanoarchaeota archaeon]
MVDTSALLGSNTDAYTSVANYLGISVTTVLIIVLILSIWALIWKGFALWKSANKRSLIWFIALLILNTFGILEILYIFVFSKMNFKKKDKKKK